MSVRELEVAAAHLYTRIEVMCANMYLCITPVCAPQVECVRELEVAAARLDESTKWRRQLEKERQVSEATR